MYDRKWSAVDWVEPRGEEEGEDSRVWAHYPHLQHYKVARREDVMQAGERKGEKEEK